MKEPHVIYSFADRAAPDRACYVGVTKACGFALDEDGLLRRARRRFEVHRSCGDRRRPVTIWLRSLIEKPILGVLGLIDGRDAAHELEAWWIGALARDGHPLRNVRGVPKEFRRADIFGVGPAS